MTSATEDSERIAFLVADGTGCRLGVAVTSIETIIDESAFDLDRAAVNLGHFGDVAVESELRARVLCLKGETSSATLTVRSSLRIVTVPRADIQPLPPIVAARARMFGGVAIGDGFEEFLILDVDGAVEDNR